MVRLSRDAAALGPGKGSTLRCGETGSLLRVAEVRREPGGCPGQINTPHPTLSPRARRAPSHPPALWGSRCHSAWCDPVKASPGGLNHIPLQRGHIWYKHSPVPKEPGLIPAAESQSSPGQGELRHGFDPRHPHPAGTGLACERWGGRGGPQLRAELRQSEPELVWPDPAPV